MVSRATSHTRLRARDHSTSSTLIGGKGGAGPSSSFTLRLRDQRSMWLQDGHNVYMDPYVASNGPCVHGYLNYFQQPSLGGRFNVKPGDHGTPNAYNRWFILFYHAWGPAWIEIHSNSIWLRTRSHDFTLHLGVRDRTTWFWRCLGTAFGHFLLGSQNSMVTDGSLAHVWSGP